jgi:hypothetical protein
VLLDGRRIQTPDDINSFLVEVFGADHLGLLLRMEYKHVMEDILCCHGGLIAGKSVEETEDWLYTWGSEDWQKSKYDKREGYRVCYGHWHQPIHPVFGPYRLCLALHQQVAVFCPEQRLIVTSGGMYYELDEDWSLVDWG